MRHIIRLGTVIAILLLVAACSSPSATPASTTSVGPTASAAPSESASGAPSASAAGGSAGIVTIKNFAFAPTVLTVTAGTTVTWTNEDTTGHTVTFDSGGVTSDTLQNGATFDHTFTTAGTFTYHCAIHPSMKGSVTVTQ